jgi:hypothetical protein
MPARVSLTGDLTSNSLPDANDLVWTGIFGGPSRPAGQSGFVGSESLKPSVNHLARGKAPSMLIASPKLPAHAVSREIVLWETL